MTVTTNVNDLTKEINHQVGNLTSPMVVNDLVLTPLGDLPPQLQRWVTSNDGIIELDSGNEDLIIYNPFAQSLHIPGSGWVTPSEMVAAFVYRHRHLLHLGVEGIENRCHELSMMEDSERRRVNANAEATAYKTREEERDDVRNILISLAEAMKSHAEEHHLCSEYDQAVEVVCSDLYAKTEYGVMALDDWRNAAVREIETDITVSVAVRVWETITVSVTHSPSDDLDDLIAKAVNTYVENNPDEFRADGCDTDIEINEWFRN